MAYKEINTNPFKPNPPVEPIEVEVEVNIDNDEDVFDELERLSIEAGKRHAKEQEANKAELEQAKPKPQQTSRAKKRIRELAAEKNDLSAQLVQERQANQELLTRLQEGNKTSKEVLLANLANQLELINSQIKQAIENGESDKVVDLQKKHTKTMIDMSKLEDQHTPVSRQPNMFTEQPQSTPVKPSRKALEWIEEHPTFKTDRVFYNMAMMTNNDLLQEGFDPDSDDFYEEINNRLAPRFPEVFGEDTETDVEYSDTEENRPRKDVKSPKQQTVSGASRTSNSSQPRNSKTSTKVKLTPEDLDLARKWGWSLERIAKRKLHIETTKNSPDYNGYVPIAMPGNKKEGN